MTTTWLAINIDEVRAVSGDNVRRNVSVASTLEVDAVATYVGVCNGRDGQYALEDTWDVDVGGSR